MSLDAMLLLQPSTIFEHDFIDLLKGPFLPFVAQKGPSRGGFQVCMVFKDIEGVEALVFRFTGN